MLGVLAGLAIAIVVGWFSPGRYQAQVVNESAWIVVDTRTGNVKPDGFTVHGFTKKAKWCDHSVAHDLGDKWVWFANIRSPLIPRG